MALLALPAASTYLQMPPGAAAPIAFPAAGTSLATFTGFTFPNDENTIVVVFVGAAGTGTIQFVPAVGSAPAALTLANSTNYIFGPIPSAYNNATGLVTANLSVVTGNSVSVFKLLHKGVTSVALHSPLEPANSPAF